MSYQRRQQDLERRSRKGNTYAKSLSNPKYRQRRVENKKKKKLNKKTFNLDGYLKNEYGEEDQKDC